MRSLLLVSVLLVTSGPVSGQTARVPASTMVARAFGLIAPDVGGQAVRTDVTATADGLILRVTPSDPAAEWSPTRTGRTRAVTATVRYDGAIHDFGLLNGLANEPATRALFRHAGAELKHRLGK